MSKSDSTQNLPSSFTLPPQLLAQAADTYRHPAPPPQLPAVQLVPRHQEPVINPKEKHSPNGYPPNGAGVGIVRCPEGRAWQERNMHAGEKLGRFRDQDVDGFVADMAMVLRKEYDCWVEQCWYVLLFGHGRNGYPMANLADRLLSGKKLSIRYSHIPFLTSSSISS